MLKSFPAIQSVQSKNNGSIIKRPDAGALRNGNLGRDFSSNRIFHWIRQDQPRRKFVLVMIAGIGVTEFILFYYLDSIFAMMYSTAPVSYFSVLIVCVIQRGLSSVDFATLFKDVSTVLFLLKTVQVNHPSMDDDAHWDRMAMLVNQYLFENSIWKTPVYFYDGSSLRSLFRSITEKPPNPILSRYIMLATESLSTNPNMNANLQTFDVV